jgi:autotransporter translocation and assembly factor TamB
MRTLVHILKWITAGLLAILTLLLIIFSLAQTNLVKERISSIIAKSLSSRTGLEIDLVGLDGLVPFDIHLARFAASDEEGEFLEIRNFHLRTSALSLLLIRLNIEELSSSSVILQRLPSESEKSSEESSEMISRTIELPGLSIAHFGVDTLIIGESLLGERASYSVVGSFTGTCPLPCEVAAVRIERLDGPG